MEDSRKNTAGSVFVHVNDVDASTPTGRRRALVQGVALGIGGATLSHWTRPVVETVILPAHAQTTQAIPPIQSGGPVITGSGFGSTMLNP